ncbi:MAG: MopE-related protein [Polyangiales bacterium]
MPAAPPARRPPAPWAPVALAALLACVRAQDLGAAGCAADAACDVADAASDAALRCARPEETVGCYEGPPGTLGVGRCRAGVRRCDPLRGRFAGACEAQVAPAAAELCGDGVDDDCDGAADEDCAAPRFTAVAVADRASCVVVREGGAGRLACWGDGAWGLFGDDRRVRTRPEAVAAPAGVSALAMGAAHLCAVAAGRVWCVGRNDSGALGDGSLDDRAAFVQAAGVEGASEVAAGRFHTCALARGAVWCWGADAEGQTGADAATPCARGGARGCVLRPARVALPGAAVAVRAGFAHACALLAGGEAWCWGERGAFGGGASTPSRVAVSVGALAAGGRATCWAAGAVTCVGRLAGLDPPLGDDVARFAGGQRWCAVIGGDRLRCTDDAWWPSPDAEGALSVPLGVADVVEGEGSVGAAAMGVSHGCALWGAGAVRCWGATNAHGQLGVGSTAVWAAPLAPVAW